MNKKICIECGKDFEPISETVDTCNSCLIRPKNWDRLEKEEQEKTAICLECNVPFVKTGRNQKFCPACHDKKLATPKKVMTSSIDIVDKPIIPSSLQVQIEALMDLAGVKRMELVYDAFKISIERT